MTASTRTESTFFGVFTITRRPVLALQLFLRNRTPAKILSLRPPNSHFHTTPIAMSATPKKVVVCGGTGFLGTPHSPWSCSLPRGD